MTEELKLIYFEVFQGVFGGLGTHDKIYSNGCCLDNTTYARAQVQQCFNNNDVTIAYEVQQRCYSC